MTWGELKSNLINLGFESDKAYGENPKLFIQAVNRDMSLIVGTVRFTQKKTTVTTTLEKEEITVEAERFNRILAIKRAGESTPANYTIIEYNVVRFNEPGEYDVFYAVFPQKIDESTQDTYAIDMQDDLLQLVPLLAAHYIWLDDDERKAVMYWNEYDSLKQEIMMRDASSQRVRVRVETGWQSGTAQSTGGA